MADQRVTHAAVITDPSTSTQQAGVDGSGHLQVDIAADSVGIGGGTQYTEDAAAAANPVGNAQILVRQDTPAALVTTDGDNVARRGTDYGAAYSQLVTSAGAYIDDLMLGTDFSSVLGTASLITATQADDLANTTDTLNTSALLYAFDGTTWDRARGDATDGLLVNLGSNNDVTVTGTVDLGATDNAVLDSIAANTSGLNNTVGTDGAAGPSSALSVAGTETGGTLQEIRVDADGHLQVDVLSGAGSTTPTNPVVDAADATTPTTIAAGASSNIDSPDLASKRLTKAVIWGSAPFKAVLSTLTNGSATTFCVAGGGGYQTFTWDTPHLNYVQSGSSAGADGFRAAVTNLDPADSADFYVTWYYED